MVAAVSGNAYDMSLPESELEVMLSQPAQRPDAGQKSRLEIGASDWLRRPRWGTVRVMLVYNFMLVLCRPDPTCACELQAQLGDWAGRKQIELELRQVLPSGASSLARASMLPGTHAQARPRRASWCVFQMFVQTPAATHLALHTELAAPASF